MSVNKLTDTQLQELITHLENKNYRDAYQVILDATGNDESYEAWTWFDNAQAINSGIGPADEFITGYMDAATWLGFGADNDLNADLYQQASDLIAQSVLTNIVLNDGQLPSFQEIIDRDAAVAIDFLGIEPLEWGGTLGQYFFSLMTQRRQIQLGSG